MKFRVIDRQTSRDAQSPVRVIEQTTGREVGWINRYLDREYVRRLASGTLRLMLTICCTSSAKPEFVSSLDLYPPLISDDLGKRSRGIANFLRACFHKQPGQNDFEVMLAYNAAPPCYLVVVGRSPIKGGSLRDVLDRDRFKRLPCSNADTASRSICRVRRIREWRQFSPHSR
jgi:hypothetical protein